MGLSLIVNSPTAALCSVKGIKRFTARFHALVNTLPTRLGLNNECLEVNTITDIHLNDLKFELMRDY